VIGRVVGFKFGEKGTGQIGQIGRISGTKQAS
jgi:hypothetical protein